MTMYYFKSHLQLEPSSAAYSDQLLSEEAYRSLAAAVLVPHNPAPEVTDFINCK